MRMSVEFNNSNGIQHGHIFVPHSHDKSAWGQILIPICVASNGTGPTVLVIGGNHGDEYEGPIAIQSFISELNLDHISGTVIFIPFLNYPAVLNGTRTSPIDKGNMNRVFPGNPRGSISERIAHFITEHFICKADAVLDFHSGGKTLEMVCFAASHTLHNQDHEKRNEVAALAFGAPYTIKLREIDNQGMLDTTVEEMGKTFVTTELGGGGNTTTHSLSIAKTGLVNFLSFTGVLKKERQEPSTTKLVMPSEDCFLVSEGAGIVEFLCSLDSMVEKGQVIANVWSLEQTGQMVKSYKAGRDGMLIGRHFPGLIEKGDCLAVLATKVDH